MNHVVSSFLLFFLASLSLIQISMNKTKFSLLISYQLLAFVFPFARPLGVRGSSFSWTFSPDATSSSVAVATPPSPLATIPAATSARHGFFRQGFDAWDVLSPVSFGTKNSTCHPRSSFRMLMRPSLACRASLLLGYVRRDRLLLV